MCNKIAMKSLPGNPAARGVLMAILIALSGCATPTPSLDPNELWQRAAHQHDDVIASVARREQLHATYKTIIRLSRDNNLRGQAFIRLAELDLALGDYEQALHNLEQSLRVGPYPAHQRQALLLLGDLRERHFNDASAAVVAYRQIVNEHPATTESEIAGLRLRELLREQ